MANDIEVENVINEMTKASRKMKDTGGIEQKSRQYWKRVFDRMDEYSAVPYHRRLNELEATILDPNLVYRLRNIYDVLKHEDVVDFTKELDTTTSTILLPMKRDPIEKAFINYEYNTLCINSSINLRAEKYKKEGTRQAPTLSFKSDRPSTVDYRKELIKSKDEMADKEESMYANFLNKSESKANRWRPKPPVTVQGMSLSAKCDAITKEIATNFVDWMNNLGGETKGFLDVQGIEALFEIGFNNHAADSLAVHVEELNAVTEAVARARQAVESSYSTQLYRQLHRDMTSVKSREANFAFGTMLPPEMRSGTTQDTSVSKWLQNKRVPERLATMAVVWEGIEALKSTEGYCNWLQEHEEITPPTYLAGKGLLDRKKDIMSEHTKSVGSVNTQVLSLHSNRSRASVSKSLSMRSENALLG